MAYVNAYTAATNDALHKRIEMALFRYCTGLLGSASPQQEQDLAKQVLADASGYAVRFSKAICAKASLATSIDADPTGASLTDAQIDTQLALAYNAFMR